MSDFAKLAIRDKIALIERERLSGYTNAEIAERHGLGVRQRVSQILSVKPRLYKCPKGQRILDAIDDERLSFDKVRPRIAGTMDPERLEANKDELLEEAQANLESGRRIARGYNPRLGLRDRRAAKWRHNEVT